MPSAAFGSTVPRPISTRSTSVGSSERTKIDRYQLSLSSPGNDTTSRRTKKRIPSSLRGWHHREYNGEFRDIYVKDMDESMTLSPTPSSVEHLYAGWKNDWKERPRLFSGSSVESPHRPLPGKVIPWAGLRPSEYSSPDGMRSISPSKSPGHSRKAMQRSLSKAFSRSVGSDTPLGSATFKVMKLARINDQRGLREYFNVWVNADALRQQVNLLSKQKTAMLQLEGSLRSRARKAEEEAFRLREELEGARPPSTAERIMFLGQTLDGPVKAWQQRILTASLRRWSAATRRAAKTTLLETPVQNEVGSNTAIPDASAPIDPRARILLGSIIKILRRCYVGISLRRWWKFVQMTLLSEAAVTAAKAAADERVVDLEAHVAELAASIATMSQNSELALARSRTSELEAAVETTAAALAAERRRTTELEAAVGTSATALAARVMEVNELNRAVEAGGQELKVARSRIAVLETDLNNAVKRYESPEAEIQELKKRTEELEASLMEHTTKAFRTVLQRWCSRRELAAWHQWRHFLVIDGHHAAVMVESGQKSFRSALQRWCLNREAAAWRQWRLSMSIDEHRAVVIEEREKSALAFASVGRFRRRMAEYVTQRIGKYLRRDFLKQSLYIWQQVTQQEADLERQNQELLDRIKKMEDQMSEATAETIRAVAMASAEGEKKGRELGLKQVRDFALFSPGSKRAKRKAKKAWADWCEFVKLAKEEEENAKKAAAEDPIGAVFGTVFGGFVAPWDTPVASPQKGAKPAAADSQPQPNSPWGAWG